MRGNHTGAGPNPADRAKGLAAAIVFLVTFILGAFTADDTIRTVCAIVSVAALTSTMVIVFKGYKPEEDDSHKL